MTEAKINLKNLSLLTLMDFSKEQIEYLVDLAAKLKKDKKEGKEVQNLKGKNIALIFEKDSTRTRCAFEVAAFDQGAHVTYMGPSGSQFGKKESAKDSARVLGRMYDAIQYRGYAQKTVEDLAKYSGVPVYNGLTNEDHPTQVLADLLTIKEHCNKPFNEVKLVYIGDGRNNMANALLIGACKMGMKFSIVSPEALFPTGELVDKCKKCAGDSGAEITITSDIEEGVKDADFIYTDVWVSMGEAESVWKERIEMLLPYQVNTGLLNLTENGNTKFMHCLPAFHDINTEISQEIYDKFGITEMEVSDEVFEGDASIVFDEAENRLHTIKAVMVATLS
ncbi:MAG: ornithine carbamoyltransferase [Clostridiaceae bacterium]